MELYDYGENAEMARSFNPELIMLTTSFTADRPRLIESGANSCAEPAVLSCGARSTRLPPKTAVSAIEDVKPHHISVRSAEALALY